MHMWSRSDGSQETWQGLLGSMSNTPRATGLPGCHCRRTQRGCNGTWGAMSQIAIVSSGGSSGSGSSKTHSLQRAECGLGLDYVMGNGREWAWVVRALELAKLQGEISGVARLRRGWAHGKEEGGCRQGRGRDGVGGWAQTRESAMAYSCTYFAIRCRPLSTKAATGLAIRMCSLPQIWMTQAGKCRHSKQMCEWHRTLNFGPRVDVSQA
jgi:hypothetical protein